MYKIDLDYFCGARTKCLGAAAHYRHEFLE